MSPIIDEEGEIESIVSVITDLTSIRTAESELRRLSLIASESSHGIITRDPDGTVTWVNKAFEKIIGFTSEELIGQDIGPMVIGPETNMEVLEEAIKNRIKGEIVDAEVLFYKKDRSTVWIYFTSYPIFDKQGILESVVTTIVDVTEDKEREEKVRLLSLVASKSATGVAISNQDDKPVWVNNSFEKITGYSLEDFKGGRIGDLMNGPKTDLIEVEQLRKRSATKEPYNTELLAYRKDGSEFWLSVMGTPVLNMEGAISEYVEIFNDITSRKLAEIELISTRQEALELGKAKEAFLSFMSHEIRSPLGSIIGLTELLLDTEPSPDQLELIKLLKFSGDNLNAIVNDILDLTKLETENLRLEKAEVNLFQLATQTVQTLQVKAEEVGTKLFLDIDPALDTKLFADSVRLYQILMNLVGNAIKFTKNGEVKISMHVQDGGKNSLKVKFDISDTGIGIPEERINIIFEPYKQAAADTTRKYGGTGLGLPIVKRLVELHGASVQVKSVVGVGSSFSFEILFERANAKRGIERVKVF